MKPPKGSPCRECPFRRKSLQGYLGANDVAEFVLSAEGGQTPLPCHLEVDYERRDWKEQIEQVHQCSGHAIMLTNMCKGGVGPGVHRLPADTENVFRFPSEMLVYHSHGKLKHMGDAYEAVLRKTPTTEEPMAKKKATKQTKQTKKTEKTAQPLLGEDLSVAAQSIADAIDNALHCGDSAQRRAGMPRSAADAIANTADSLERVADALHSFSGTSTTELSGVPLLAKEVLDGTTRIAEAIHALAKAVDNSGK